MNSRNKGKRGELELAKFLKGFGYDARRGQQYSGANGDADVIGVPGLHIECKRVESLNVEKALLQAENDAPEGQIPIVFHRRNGESWKVTLRADVFMRIYQVMHPSKKRGK